MLDRLFLSILSFVIIHLTVCLFRAIFSGKIIEEYSSLCYETVARNALGELTQEQTEKVIDSFSKFVLYDYIFLDFSIWTAKQVIEKELAKNKIDYISL